MVGNFAAESKDNMFHGNHGNHKLTIFEVLYKALTFGTRLI